MENYISTVLNKIKDGKVKAEIQAELEDHYNERVEYYTRIGYDKETAEAKANAHFGDDAEIVGEQIALVNKKDSILSVIFAIINVGLLLFPFVFGIFILLMASDHYQTTEIAFFVSIVLSVFCFAELFVSLKNRTWYLSVLCTLNFIFLGIIYMGYCPIVFCIYKAFKGELNSFVDLIYHYNWSCTNKTIYACCIAFYVLCIALSIFSGILVNRFKQCKYSKKNFKQEKVLKISLFSLILIFLICFACVSLYPQENSGNGEWRILSGVYVIESDEMIDPHEVSDYDKNYLDIHWEVWDGPHIDDDNDTFFSHNTFEDRITEKYDENADFYYVNYNMYGEFHPTKKYVCVISDYHSGADFTEYNWVETSEEYLFESKRDSMNVKYEIKILPKEDSVGN